MTKTDTVSGGAVVAPPDTRRPRRATKILVYAALRVLRLLSIIFGVTLISFFLIKLSPGDPVASALGPESTPEQVERLRSALGLDRPAWQQYLDWLSGVLRGDFGTTLSQPSRSVAGEFANRLPITIELGLLTILLSLTIAVPLAIWSAHRAGQRFDRTTSAVLYGFVSVPGFVAALLLILLFIFNRDTARLAGLAVAGLAIVAMAWACWRAVRSRSSVLAPFIGGGVTVLVGLAVYALLPEFPRQGFTPISEGVGTNLRSVALPVIALTLVDIAVFTRILRGDMITELSKPYILSSRAKGMSTSHILMREALRPSMFSLTTVVGLSIGQLIGGTIIVEQIFRLPGVGSLLVTSVRNGDYPVVQATIFIIAATYVTLNALIDLSYSYFDPRVRQVNPR